MMIGNRIRNNRLEIEGKDGECSLMWCRPEKIRGELQGPDAVLAMNSSRVNAGMRDKCAKASMFKEVSGQSTSSRFRQQEI